MNKGQKILSPKETLNTLNSIALDYYEMGLPKLSEQIWRLLYKQGYAYYLLHQKQSFHTHSKKTFAIFRHSGKK